ncbi:MAG TPA: dienelactone hydrolase family protein [Aliidongia sp.]|uniref:dienelactone hydrolase family protein n=1 Tax=Aliidongia sp. TaxID=1914230 RepID=UPI002DDD8B95|nr:dienelactone hydrolase family protein [Aliidongia sp.]HEV2675739.1 dienelactone hydrolase family protein [Aliidongia sp.]
MGQMIELTAADGFKLGAYRADPDGTPKGAIVVVQEIFGVNGHIRNVADGFAAEGYVAIAPAIFDRAQPGIELGYDQAGVDAGIKARSAIPLDGTLADLQAAIDAVEDVGKVGIVGYCWGGTLAFAAAGRLAGLSAAVGYYGGQIVSSFLDVEPQIPIILHFGETDHGIPLTDVQKIIDRYPTLPIHTYQAGHGFNCDQRGSYDKPSAELALTRTLEFFRQHLV